jgi:hypothetical protein
LQGLQLGVSAYERAASLIMSLLILVGFFVAVLLVLVFTQRLVQAPPQVEVELLEEPSGRGDHPIGTEFDTLEPGAMDFPSLAEPSFEKLIDSLDGLLASDTASLNEEALWTGSGQGAGDRRRAGPLGNSNLIPRAQRWEINYSDTTLKSYAAQLDFFSIELGVIGGGVEGIDYVAGFDSSARQVRHVNDPDAEDRLYFTWRSGQLQEFDRQLARDAGVSVTGRKVLQFYPPEVENRLALLEREALQGRSLESVRKTRFGVRPAGSGYEYYVISIESR